jgi:hypothetical protein
MWHHIIIREQAYRRLVTDNNSDTGWASFLGDAFKAALRVINARRLPPEQVTESQLMTESLADGRRADPNDPGDSYVRI